MKKMSRRCSLLFFMLFVVTSAFTLSAGAATVKTLTIYAPTTKSSYSVSIGSESVSFTLKMQVNGDTISYKKNSSSFLFASSNSKIADVSSSGKVTARTPGSAKITVASKSNKKIVDTLTVKVTQRVTKIKISGNDSVDVGKKIYLEGKIYPSNASNKDISWSSSNKKIASVNSKGTVAGISVGKVTITASSKDGSKVYAKKTITVRQPVTKISISGSSTVYTGKQTSLSLKISPSNASDKSVKWESSNTAVATVSSKGVVAGVTPGTATIRATAKDGSKIYRNFIITVKKSSSFVYVSKISLGGASGVTTGKTTILSASVSPSKATYKNIVWKSSNTKIATVDSKGKITGVKAGTAVITATAADGSKKYAAKTITVTQLATGIKVAAANDSLWINGKTGAADTTSLKASISPSDATNKAVSYDSNNKSVAVVDSNGKITAKGVGTAVITAKTKDGTGKSAAVTIYVGRFSAADSSLIVGKTSEVCKIEAPSKMTNKTIKVATADNEILSVSGTKITGVGRGTATLKVSPASGTQSQLISVSVKDAVLTKVLLPESFGLSAQITVVDGMDTQKYLTQFERLEELFSGNTFAANMSVTAADRTINFNNVAFGTDDEGNYFDAKISENAILKEFRCRVVTKDGVKCLVTLNKTTNEEKTIDFGTKVGGTLSINGSAHNLIDQLVKAQLLLNGENFDISTAIKLNDANIRIETISFGSHYNEARIIDGENKAIAYKFYIDNSHSIYFVGDHSTDYLIRKLENQGATVTVTRN